MKIQKIALTGGPGAGKTTILEDYKNYLNSLNICNMTLKETASEINQEYRVPFQSREHGNLYDFQELIYTQQKYKEDVALFASKIIGKDTIILCDRGIPDNRAYLYNEEFDELAKKYNENILSIANNYNYVIALSSASTLDNGYTTENNPSRLENKEEALEKNKRTLECWTLARNIHIIPAMESFEDKRTKSIELLQTIINGQNIKRTQKFNSTGVDIDYLKKDCEVFKQKVKEYVLGYNDTMTKTYLEDIEYNNNHVYYITKKQVDNYQEKIISDERITQEEFELIINNNKIENQTEYYEERFIKNNLLYKIKTYDNVQILEIEVPKDKVYERIIKDERLTRIDNYRSEMISNVIGQVRILSKNNNV